MKEEDVTLAVKTYLENNNRKILWLNNPFSWKWIWIKPIWWFRWKWTLIPDIIAKKWNDYLIVEAYDKLKIKDIYKLEKYSKIEYINSIKQIFNENWKILIKKSLAYPYPIKNFNYPKDLIIFLVKENLDINVVIFNN